MASEREFLKQRYRIICQRMAKINNYNVDANGNFYLAYQPDPNIDYTLLLESWLIQKLLDEVKEGYVQKALVSWRKNLGAQWQEHCNYYREIELRYNEWAALPWPLRWETPEPPQPPDLEVKDVSGHIWVVDSRLLDVLESICVRLAKWMDYEK
jgi:hypothetical protein